MFGHSLEEEDEAQRPGPERRQVSGRSFQDKATERSLPFIWPLWCLDPLSSVSSPTVPKEKTEEEKAMSAFVSSHHSTHAVQFLQRALESVGGEKRYFRIPGDVRVRMSPQVCPNCMMQNS